MAESPFGERLTKSGAVLLGRNQLTLLQALLDRPDATASSVEDWLAAATPYLEGGYWALRKSVRRMNPAWIERRRVGRCITAKLLPRGHAILSREVPAHVHGVGPYRRANWRHV